MKIYRVHSRCPSGYECVSYSIPRVPVNGDVAVFAGISKRWACGSPISTMNVANMMSLFTVKDTLADNN